MAHQSKHQSKQLSARRRVPQQIDLFAGEPQTTLGSMPAWSGLPKETQAALTSLMTRLILDHVDQSGIGGMTEGGHDH
jgi:hypothetical protein